MVIVGISTSMRVSQNLFTLTVMCAGQPQNALAQDASRILCRDKAEHHAITLSTMHKGVLRHTLYEMWPGDVDHTMWFDQSSSELCLARTFCSLLSAAEMTGFENWN